MFKIQMRVSFKMSNPSPRSNNIHARMRSVFPHPISQQEPIGTIHVTAKTIIRLINYARLPHKICEARLTSIGTGALRSYLQTCSVLKLGRRLSI